MTIGGRLLSAATGKPVPGAVATASCDECGSAPVTANADIEGRFAIAVSTPGRYRVRASAPGYVDAAYGEAPALGATPVAVTRGAEIRGIDITLHRGGTIAGLVTDDFGDPVVGATVRALTRREADGEATWAAAAASRTDDHGAYRLIGLHPGEYLVCVSDGLAAACAAASGSPTTARRVALDTDAAQDGINIRMKTPPTGTIAGLVAGPGAGSPALVISLLPDPNPARLPALAGRPQAGGRFAFSGLPAGAYVLFVRPSSTTAPSPAALSSWARERVFVTADVTTHVAVTLRTGARVSGTVAAAALSRGARVELAPVGSDHPEAASAQAVAGADGSFTIANIAPGRYRWATTPSLTQSGARLMSVFVNDQDVTDRPIDIAPDTALEHVRVTLTEPARVTGTVIDAAGTPSTTGTVVLAAADSRDWTPLSRRIQAVRPDTDGVFEFRVPAGRYRIVAVTALAPGQLHDSAFLKTFAGPVVTAVSGQTTPVRIRRK